MRTILCVLTLLAITFIISCAQNRSDPMGVAPEGKYGGSLSSWEHLPNENVTEDTKFDLIQRIFLQAFDTYRKAIQVSTQAGDPEQTVRVLGVYNGTATSSMIIPDSLPSSGSLIYNLTLVFNDFSDNGRLFVGGTVNFSGVWRNVNGRTIPVNLKLNNGLEFAGDYTGDVALEGIRVAIDEQGEVVDLEDWLAIPARGRPVLPTEGSVIIESGPNRLLFNPYFIDFSPDQQ